MNVKFNEDIAKVKEVFRTWGISIFLWVTYVWNMICFNFNKIIDRNIRYVCTSWHDGMVVYVLWVLAILSGRRQWLRVVSEYIIWANCNVGVLGCAACDDTLISYGLATNKVRLIMLWYWDHDFNGLPQGALPWDGKVLTIIHKLDATSARPLRGPFSWRTSTLKIDVAGGKYTSMPSICMSDEPDVKEIMFGEIPFDVRTGA